MCLATALLLGGGPPGTGAQGVSVARPALPAPRPYRLPAVREQTLPNGLRIVVVERHDLPLVVVRTVFLASPAGADPPGKEGAFGLMRALIADATVTRPADSLGARFATMGSRVSDSGFVTTTADFDSSTTILADMLMHPRLAPDPFMAARARRVAVVRQAAASANLITTQILTATLFGSGHPFARFESETSLAAVGLEDVVASHAEWVRSATTALVVVGDVTPERAFARVAAAFGSWSTPRAGQVPASGASVAPPPTAIYLTDLPGPNAWIVAGMLTPSRDSPDMPALDVLNAVYGALTGSRLSRELRDNRGLAYTSPSAFLRRPVPAPSMLYSLLPAIAPDRVDSAVSVLLRELRGIAGERPPGTGEFDDARDNRIASLPLQLETHEALARQLSDLLQQNLPPESIDRNALRLASLTRDQVIAVARADLHADRVAVVIAGDVAALEPRLRRANLAPVYIVDANGRRLR